eukprot:tig00021128_g18892.t1
MFYGAERWEPRLILRQIALMQFSYYAALSVLFFGFDAIFGYEFGLQQLFSYSSIRFTDGRGWLACIIFVIASLASAWALRVFVERSKKCLDFTLTLHLIHFVATWIYGGFPKAWEWWIAMILSCIIMSVLGEFFCMRKEMREIPLTGASPARPSKDSAP